MLAQNDVLRFSFAQVVYPYPFPSPEINNADCVRLAAFDDLDLSAQVTEGNGVSAVFEAYGIAFLHFEDLADRRQFVRNRRQRTKRDFFFLHEISSRKAVGTRRQGACVEFEKFFADSLVDFFETEELASSQSRQYEALALVDSVLNHRLAPRFSGSDCNRNGAVVVAELPVLLAKSRAILVRFDHQRGRVVQINMLWNSAEKGEHLDLSVEPVVSRLSFGRTAENISGRRQNADEDLRCGHLAEPVWRPWQGVAAVINHGDIAEIPLISEFHFPA